jgi:hypothetical protein
MSVAIQTYVAQGIVPDNETQPMAGEDGDHLPVPFMEGYPVSDNLRHTRRSSLIWHSCLRSVYLAGYTITSQHALLHSIRYDAVGREGMPSGYARA